MNALADPEHVLTEAACTASIVASMRRVPCRAFAQIGAAVHDKLHQPARYPGRSARQPLLGCAYRALSRARSDGFSRHPPDFVTDSTVPLAGSRLKPMGESR